MSELWERIHAARKASGLTQDKVAAAIGVTRAGVALWESNNPKHQTSPSLQNLRELSKAIGVPMEWLMDDNSDPGEAWKLFGQGRQPVAFVIPKSGEHLPDIDMDGWSVKFALNERQLAEKYQAMQGSDGKRLLIVVGKPCEVIFADSTKEALEVAFRKVASAPPG